MRLAAIVAFLIVRPAFAQFDLATTQDGSALYFSVVQQGDPDIKIYRWTRKTGVTLFADRPDLADPHYGVRLTGTQLTIGGTVLYHAGPNCPIGSGVDGNHCPSGQTIAVVPGMEPFSEPGYLLVSPNGRYGVSTPYDGGALWTDWVTGESRMVDFGIAGFIPDTNSPFHPNQHAVANDGSFVIAHGSSGLTVWSPTGERSLPQPDFFNAIISADASTVAVTHRDACCLGQRTFVYDLASDRIAVFNPGVSMSDDGKTVAYLSADPSQPPFAFPQPLVAHSDGTGINRVGYVAEGVHDILLSGDGKIVFAVTGDPELPGPHPILRFDLIAGAIVEIQVGRSSFHHRR